MDDIITQCAKYVLQPQQFSAQSYQTAAYCLLDALGCSALALQHKVCARLLGPVCAGSIVPNGARVPGTKYVLDPIKAAFDIGTSIRWLDYNDTFLAKEWGHPSDNLGAILACCDYVNNNNKNNKLTTNSALTIKQVLNYIIKAYEIQGVLSLENSFNAKGIDHVILVKVASAALAAMILGGDFNQIAAAISQAWIDGHSLRIYRHSPNTGSRKSWAAGDATARGVQLAMLTLLGEGGYASALTSPVWGLQDVLFHKQKIVIKQDLNSYVIDNILFKVSSPAEFHAQTALEAAIELHHKYKTKINIIEKINIYTQAAAIKIISKQGKLSNPADRDHCLEYIVAIGLLYGQLSAKHYEDNIATDPRIDALRQKMQVQENTNYTKLYYDPNSRAIPNAIKLFFADGSSSEEIEVLYPLGHKRRRDTAVNLIITKAETNLKLIYSPTKIQQLINCLIPIDKKLDYSFADFYNILFKE